MRSTIPFEQRRKQGKTLKDGFKKLNSAISATVRETDYSMFKLSRNLTSKYNLQVRPPYKLLNI